MQKVPVIAIVDDDASLRLATRSLVRSLGFTAHTYASAEDFLQSQHVSEYSCVITDVQMPGLSGVDLQSRLAAEGRDTPVIFMTAFADPAMKARAMKAGAICVLSKPFEGQMLVRYLEEALSQGNSSRQ